MSNDVVIYIAGPMRSILRYNFPAFDAAARMLEGRGYTVVNPAEMDRRAGFDAMTLPHNYDWSEIPDGFDFTECVTRDIAGVRDCDVLYLLDGWEASAGARAENAIAEWLGKEIMYQTEGVEV